MTFLDLIDSAVGHISIPPGVKAPADLCQKRVSSFTSPHYRSRSLDHLDFTFYKEVANGEDLYA